MERANELKRAGENEQIKGRRMYSFSWEYQRILSKQYSNQLVVASKKRVSIRFRIVANIQITHENFNHPVLMLSRPSMSKYSVYSAALITLDRLRPLLNQHIRTQKIVFSLQSNPGRLCSYFKLNKFAN